MRGHIFPKTKIYIHEKTFLLKKYLSLIYNTHTYTYIYILYNTKFYISNYLIISTKSFIYKNIQISFKLRNKAMNIFIVNHNHES